MLGHASFWSPPQRSVDYGRKVLKRAATIALAVLAVAAVPQMSHAKVLARGLTVNKRPVTVVAAGSAFMPSQVKLDARSHPAARVRIEWMVLCSDGPRPTTGGSFVANRPTHRRLKLPSRPRGLCHLEAEAHYTDSAQIGHIAVMLRGHVERKPFFLLPAHGSRR